MRGRGPGCARTVAVVWLALWGGVAPRAAAQAGPSPSDRQQEFDERAQLVLTSEAVDALLFRGGAERSLDGARSVVGGADLFSKTAPAVVVVRTATAHGTGFLVGREGWILS